MRCRIELSILLAFACSCRTMSEAGDATSGTEPTTNQGASNPPSVEPGWVATEDYRPPEGVQIRFDPPPGWIDDTPSDGTRLARYRLPSADESVEQATVTVDDFGLDGRGDRESTLNWWAAMFEPSLEADSGNHPLAISSAIMGYYRDSRGDQHRWCRTFTDVEICGTYLGESTTGTCGRIRKEDWCMLATIHGGTRGSGPYYVRLVGPASEVDRWRTSYQSFLYGAKPNR